MKDAFYFSHDSNASNDPKCILLIDQLGLEGYGIFWVLIEILRDQSDYTYPIAMLRPLARRYGTSEEKMLAVVMKYDLFTIANDEFFFSESLSRRMEALDRKREQARAAGQISAQKRLLLNGRSTDVQPTLDDRSTSKVNKSKENKSNTPIPPTGGTDEDFERFWKAYPRKIGKGAAKQEFKKIKPSTSLLEKMISAVEACKKTEQWKKDGGQYIPHPKTWLHQGRWDDEIEKPHRNMGWEGIPEV